MKKSNVTVIFILFLLIGSAGCTDQYRSERDFYRATKLSRNILINPEAIPPREFQRAVNAYKLVIERYPDTWSAKKAGVALGSLYLAKGAYREAREKFEEILGIYPADKNVAAEAKFLIGKSYENEEMWDKAILEYQELIKDYPDTVIGIGLPMYIAQYYEKGKDIIERNRIYGDVIMHYTEISEENPNTEIAFKADSFIAMCYLKIENWPQAVKSLGKLAMDYPMNENIELTLRMVEDISVSKLNSPELAVEIFDKFLKEYPDHPLREHLIRESNRL
ncbi:MAG: tetratricopeptide repeat protein [Candidatus Omnitrophica bacterium]|nr:tetratricopeptide repeat protein [Candidatus Omnitrophota bacterium]